MADRSEAARLHACTETFEEGDNDRFRDLLDPRLLGALVADDDWAYVRSACIEVFEGRAKHSWPPDVTIPVSWDAGYRALAEATGFAVTEVSGAAAAVGALITRIDSA